MTAPKSFSSVDGTELRYTADCRSWARRTDRAETSFHNKLVSWVRQLRYDSAKYSNSSSFSTVKWLGHAGLYTCKDGCHGRGRAFDLNRVVWNGYTLDICDQAHASSSLAVRRRYLAVDAGCRYRFRYTLDGWYNAAHRNHIHFDDHTSVLLSKGSRSDTGFVQAVCNNFDSASLVIDGAWGPKTQSAFDAINKKWRYSTSTCSPFTSTWDYRAWLYLVIAHGYRNRSAGSYWAHSSCR